MAVKNHKISYKLYEPDGTFITDITSDVISGFSVTKTINAGLGALQITLNRPIDNYDEYDAVKNTDGSIKYGNRIKVFLNDGDNTDTLIYYGYLTSIGPKYQGGQESVEITFYSAVSKLSNDYFRTYSDPIDFYVTETAVSTDTIIKDILDNYIDNVTYPMVSYTFGTSIADTGNVVSYTFDQQRHLQALQVAQSFLPTDWYWYCDASGLVWVQNSGSSTEHNLVLGKQVTEIKSHKTIDDLINYFFIWNGRSTADASYVYQEYNNATSETDYDTITLFQQDSGILVDSVADIRGNALISNRKDPAQQMTLELVDADYDLASIEPGHRINLRNVSDATQTTFQDGLIVTRVSYRVDSALVEVADISADLTQFNSAEQTFVELSIKQAQKSLEQIQSGDTPITKANIQYGGNSFIEDNVVYSPVLAGVNGYFKESIRMGDSGVGSVIRTYGKGAFNNSVAGIWIEKDASEDIFFELYKDGNNYLRFNTDTGKLEIAGDIEMSSSSTITWAQVASSTGRPADSATVGATWNSNISGQPSDSAITNPSYITSTKITSTTIESPSITGGTITGSTVQTGSSGKRVVLSSTGDDIQIYSSSADCGSIYGLNWGGVAQGIILDGTSIVALLVNGNSIAYTNSSGLHVVTGKEITAQWAHIDNIVFGNNSPLVENGSIYFNGTHFYGRISGSWVQLDN